MAERVFFERNNIKITTSRAIFPEGTYPIANISAVRVTKIDSGRNVRMVLAPVLLICGIFALYQGSNQQNPGLQALGGLLVVVGGGAGITGVMAADKYVVALSTSGGQVRALESTNEGLIAQIRDAIEQAIAERG
jgi:hypothetical protein